MSRALRSTQLNLSRPHVLRASFFARPALVVARELIGKVLVRLSGDLETCAVVSETEAYVGPHDLACHASKGRTARTAVMFGRAGFWYVYFIYGMHWMLNVVTDEEDFGSAVLFRAAGSWNGPARLTKALQIDKSFNGRQADIRSGLWLEDRGLKIPPRAIKRTPRIGVDYSGPWASKPYRFVMNASMQK